MSTSSDLNREAKVPLTAQAVHLAHAAIAAVDLRARTFDALPMLPPARARVVVVAVGKAAPIMARAAIDRWGFRLARVLVITTDGTSLAPLVGIGIDASRIETMTAAHPLPDDRSVAAAEAALSAVRGSPAVEAKDLALVLVSGGASPLLCAPVVGITLDDERSLFAALHESGAPIAQVNLVRRHLSRIRGGGLAKAALPGRTLTLVAGDVLVTTPEGRVEAAPPWDVGSGPGTPDPTSIADARLALRALAPEHVRFESLLHTAFFADHEAAHRTRTRTVASPLDLAEAARKVVEAAGFSVRVLPPSLDSIESLTQEIVEVARALPVGSACVRVAEPSIVLPKATARGRGGRAGRLALSVWAEGLPDDVAFASVASDGVDGSGGSGGIVSGLAPAGARDALRAFDDASFLERHGALVPAAPTGSNLLDVHVMLRTR